MGIKHACERLQTDCEQFMVSIIRLGLGLHIRSFLPALTIATTAANIAPRFPPKSAAAVWALIRPVLSGVGTLPQCLRDTLSEGIGA